MTPADFTIEFYRKCLSQAKWESDDVRDIEGLNLLKETGTNDEEDFC